MLEHLVGWFLLEYASSPGTGNALMYLEKSDARKYLNLQELFDWDRALADTSISCMSLLVGNLMSAR